MIDRYNLHVIENWRTIAFTPLTGWVNIFHGPTGEPQAHPCPGVMLQEATTATERWTEVGPDGFERDRDRDIRIPRGTRLVYADNAGDSRGEMGAVADVENYIATTTSTVWAQNTAGA